jgi:hypothetical protein
LKHQQPVEARLSTALTTHALRGELRFDIRDVLRPTGCAGDERGDSLACGGRSGDPLSRRSLSPEWASVPVDFDIAR